MFACQWDDRVVSGVEHGRRAALQGGAWGRHWWQLQEGRVWELCCLHGFACQEVGRSEAQPEQELSHGMAHLKTVSFISVFKRAQ